MLPKPYCEVVKVMFAWSRWALLMVSDRASRVCFVRSFTTEQRSKTNWSDWRRLTARPYSRGCELLIFYRFIVQVRHQRETEMTEELDGPAVSALGVRSQNLSNVRKGQSSDG
jgi:hypothetical protein